MDSWLSQWGLKLIELIFFLDRQIDKFKTLLIFPRGSYFLFTVFDPSQKEYACLRESLLPCMHTSKTALPTQSGEAKQVD